MMLVVERQGYLELDPRMPASKGDVKVFYLLYQVKGLSSVLGVETEIRLCNFIHAFSTGKFVMVPCCDIIWKSLVDDRSDLQLTWIGNRSFLSDTLYP